MEPQLELEQALLEQAPVIVQRILQCYPKGDIHRIITAQSRYDYHVNRLRDYQRPLWNYLEGGGKNAIAIWHRRAGKDEIGLHWAAVSAEKKPATYWHMLPQAAQARKAIWEAVNPHTGKRRIDEAFPLETRINTRENEMMIRFSNGSTWQVVGSDNYNSLLGSPPYGIVFSEWALADPQALAYLRPIVVENGGWMIFITTPRGYNHAKTMYDAALKDQAWFAELLSAKDTEVFTQGQLEGELAGYIAQWGEEQGRSYFEQEYHCSFESAILGAYYAGEMRKAREQGRITSVPYEPNLSVDTYWDLGVDDSTTIWFTQNVGKEIHCIDFYEMTGEGLQHYVDILEAKRAQGIWRYGKHVAPHDIKVRELGTGKSRWETALNLGLHFQIATKIEKKEDGHQAVRQIFPRLWFDSEKCEKGVNALSNYRKAYDDINKVFKGQPVHDWACHGADAMQTLAITHMGQPNKPLDWLDEAGRI
jgi:phage terminase large subunit